MKINKLDIHLNGNGEIVLSQVEDVEDITDTRFVTITRDMLDLTIEGMRALGGKPTKPQRGHNVELTQMK